MRLRRLPVISCTVLAALVSGTTSHARVADNTVFFTFTRHIAKQVGVDKQAFAQASTCLSWFYKASKKAPPPAVQGIVWERTADLDPEKDCRAHYPGGMEAARDDFARTQTLLSVSLTVYEFALVADHNDDRAYSADELQDLLQSLSLTYDAADPSQAAGATLTSHFDRWYRARNLDEVMKGMSTLYERGYRVTAQDRADLDRVMK